MKLKKLFAIGVSALVLVGCSSAPEETVNEDAVDGASVSMEVVDSSAETTTETTPAE